MPSKPEGKTERLNDTAISLFLLPPNSPNGVILEYQVRYYGYKPLERKKKRVSDVAPTIFLTYQLLWLLVKKIYTATASFSG